MAPIAGRGNGMQRDYWYTSERDPASLASPEAGSLCRRAHAVAPVGAHPHRQVPGAVRAPLALGLVGALTQAANGGALYRKASFLLDALGKPIFPAHINLTEDPHVRGAMGSSPFDDEGVRTRKRSVVTAGVLEGYFLSSYTARKLGMTTTGNAGGSPT